MFLIVSLALLLALAFFVHRNVTGVLRSVAEAHLRAVAMDAMNEAIFSALADGVRYDSLVTVTRNGAGDIDSLTSNSFEINRIARETAYSAQARLKAKSAGGVDIPLGAFSGVEAWAGFGPEVHFKLIPVSSVTCRFASSFQAAGVNQTRHAVYLTLRSNISVVTAGKTNRFAVDTQLLLCESVLLGRVPSVYLQGDLFGNGVTLPPQG